MTENMTARPPRFTPAQGNPATGSAPTRTLPPSDTTLPAAQFADLPDTFNAVADGDIPVVALKPGLSAYMGYWSNSDNGPRGLPLGVVPAKAEHFASVDELRKCQEHRRTDGSEPVYLIGDLVVCVEKVTHAASRQQAAVDAANRQLASIQSMADTYLMGRAARTDGVSMETMEVQATGLPGVKTQIVTSPLR